MDNGAEYYRCFLNGEKEALNKLIHEYWDGLALYLGNFTDSFTEAEEIAEETFVKLYTDKPDYSGRSSFKTWLYGVGRNTALYHMRKRKKFRETPIDEEYDISDKKRISSNYIPNIYNNEEHYFAGYMGHGIKPTLQCAVHIRKFEKYQNAPSLLTKILPLMYVTFVRNNQLTVIPFPFKYLREHINSL